MNLIACLIRNCFLKTYQLSLNNEDKQSHSDDLVPEELPFAILEGDGWMWALGAGLELGLGEGCMEGMIRQTHEPRF